MFLENQINRHMISYTVSLSADEYNHKNNLTKEG